MKLARGSGILLHPTCLPGPWGIGDLGPAAGRFLDFLVATGQSWWQVLPLGPTGYGNSPYMSFSTFAGNPLLVSPERLAEHGLLEAADLEPPPGLPDDRVDYPRVIALKRALLERAYRRFKTHAPPAEREALRAFRERHAAWLEDFALFMAIKEAHGEAPWTDWPRELARRDHDALQHASHAWREAVDLHVYAQHLFFAQWAALRAACRARGVRIIGDLPIYVAHDSADVWAHPDLFYLDAAGRPTVVAGVPPDYFSALGQRWGNPIFRWDARARTGYRWWIERLRAALGLVDVLRLDHFRGLEAYWEIPAEEPHAVEGRWVMGPGTTLLEALRAAVGELPVIAEDLGVITPEVERLRDEFGLPGMRILQMAFGTDPMARTYLPHNHVPRCVVYTASHDHDTTLGWFTSPPGSQTTQSREEVERERALALEYLGTDGSEIHWDLIRQALGSVAVLAIAPLQDVLGLGSEARMNRPGTSQGNWEWRVRPAMLTDDIARRLGRLTALYDRWPSADPPPGA